MKIFHSFIVASCCVIQTACVSLVSADSRATAVLQIQTNHEIARRFLQATAAGDSAAMRALMARDASLTYIVAGVYSPELHAFPGGTHWGREATIRNATAFRQAIEGPFRLDILSLIAEGDQVAAEIIGHGIRKTTHRPYIQHFSFHFEITGGQITAIRLYQDTFHLWDVWDHVGPTVRAPYEPIQHSSEQSEHPPGALTRENAVGDNLGTDKEVVLRFLAAVPAGDVKTARAMWAPDGTWCFAVGGDYSRTLHAFQDAPRWDPDSLTTMQRAVQRNLKEPMTLDVYSVIEENSRVSVEAVGFLVRPNGRAYRQHYSIHFTLRNGRLIEAHEYQDTLHMYDVKLERPNYSPVTPSRSPKDD